MLPAPTANAVVGLIAAIIAASLTLSIWEIGTRSLPQLVRDAAAGSSDPPSLLRGALRSVVGAIFAVLALAIVLRVLPSALLPVFPAFAIGIFVVALVVEALIGGTLRQIMGIRRSPSVEERGH